MKTTIFILYLLLPFNLKSQNQLAENSIKTYEELKITVPQKNEFKSQSLLYFNVGYINRKAAYIKIYENGTDENKYFDLNFDADKFMLRQNYSSIDLPSPLTVISQDIYANQSKDFYEIRRVSIYPDSTIFFYSKNIVFDEKNTLWGIPVKYKGNMSEIQKEIADNLKTKEVKNVTDSICVFEFEVTAESELRAGKLIGGKESIFTQTLYDAILLTKNKYFDDGKSKWSPAIVYSSGRPISTKFKLFARLNRNGTVTIKLPISLRNFTGN